jgi:hypothetical protein
LRDKAGRSERQWKSVLSWMLGIAGARHFLRQDGYAWVAPLSAFYPEANLSVDVQAWPPQFPKATLVADRNPASRARLRPDYIALRPVPGGQGVGAYELAVAEAKGVADQLLGKPACPRAWYKQARNVALTVNGEKVEILRHLVVATRVNPNAMKASSRRLQIRAWNRQRQPSPETQLPLARMSISLPRTASGYSGHCGFAKTH